VVWCGVERSNAELACRQRRGQKMVYVMAASVRRGVVGERVKEGAGCVYELGESLEPTRAVENPLVPMRHPCSLPCSCDARVWSMAALVEWGTSLAFEQVLWAPCFRHFRAALSALRVLFCVKAGCLGVVVVDTPGCRCSIDGHVTTAGESVVVVDSRAVMTSVDVGR
jgi:hypothetical protein